MRRGRHAVAERRANRDITGAAGLAPIRRTKFDLSTVFYTGKAPRRSRHRNGPRSRAAKAAQ